MEKWKRLGGDRGGVVVGKIVGRGGKSGGKVEFCTERINKLFFEQKNTRVLRRDFSRVLHEFCTILAINLLLDVFYLIAQGEVEFEIGFDFFNTMHNGGVVFDADFGGNFGGAHG